MAMNWRDERYVRLYTRDTPDWLCLSFLAQGLFCLLLRKVDRAGVLDLGKPGRKGVFLAIGHVHQTAMLEPALEELIADGCVEVHGDQLVIPNFMEAQEAEASDKARAKKHREKIRDLARAGVTDQHDAQESVTPESRTVTPAITKRDDGVTEIQPVPLQGAPGVTNRDATVTPNHAVPSVPPKPAAEAQRLEVVDEGGGEATPYPWPLAAQFRRSLTDRMARTVLYPIGGSEPTIMESLQASLRIVAVPDAVELCRARIIAASAANKGRVPGTLSYFAQVLADEATKRNVQSEMSPKRRTVVGVDDLGQPLFAEGRK